jgi:hypothetical protein
MKTITLTDRESTALQNALADRIQKCSRAIATASEPGAGEMLVEIEVCAILRERLRELE